MKAIHRILIEPIMTEKSHLMLLDEAGIRKYTFKVAPEANKYEIRKAVEERFEVKVADIKTMVVRGKIKRVRFKSGKRSNWKKAIIRLAPGEVISEFEGA